MRTHEYHGYVIREEGEEEFVIDHPAYVNQVFFSLRFAKDQIDNDRYDITHPAQKPYRCSRCKDGGCPQCDKAFW